MIEVKNDRLHSAVSLSDLERGQSGYNPNHPEQVWWRNRAGDKLMVIEGNSFFIYNWDDKDRIPRGCVILRNFNIVPV